MSESQQSIFSRTLLIDAARMDRARGSNDDPVFTKFTAAALAEGGGAKAINLADGTGTGSRVFAPLVIGHS
jgi:hypothetical protein